MQCLNRRVSTTATDLNLLEFMPCDTVSFEELLGHCTQVHNHKLISLPSNIIFFPLPPAAYHHLVADTDEDQDEEEKEFDDDLSLSPCISSSGATTLSFSQFHDDPLLDDCLSLKNLRLSAVCLATIASEDNNSIHKEGAFEATAKMFQENEGKSVDELMLFQDCKPRINVSRDDYESLPKHIKGLASWEDLIDAVHKMNSSLTKRCMKPDTFQQHEISSLGLGA